MGRDLLHRPGTGLARLYWAAEEIARWWRLSNGPSRWSRASAGSDAGEQTSWPMDGSRYF